MFNTEGMQPTILCLSYVGLTKSYVTPIYDLISPKYESMDIQYTMETSPAFDPV